jgi:hypothetical protein
VIVGDFLFSKKKQGQVGEVMEKRGEGGFYDDATIIF